MPSSELDSTHQITGETKRKRGGQPGNKNALKHGFYAQSQELLLPSPTEKGARGQPDRLNERAISPTNVDPLEHSESLQEEIAMLRDFMRRVVTESDRPLTHSELLDTLRVLSLAASSIARLVKIQELNLGGVEEIRRTIANAISEVAREMNLRL